MDAPTPLADALRGLWCDALVLMRDVPHLGPEFDAALDQYSALHSRLTALECELDGYRAAGTDHPDCEARRWSEGSGSGWGWWYCQREQGHDGPHRDFTETEWHDAHRDAATLTAVTSAEDRRIPAGMTMYVTADDAYLARIAEHRAVCDTAASSSPFVNALTGYAGDEGG